MEPREIHVRFARHNFDNLQSLIRFADTKAGALTGFVFILIATGSGLFQRALERVHFGCPWCAALGVIYWLTWSWFAVMAVLVVLKLLFGVVLPRSAKHYSRIDHSPHLMFWGHIALRDNNETYSQDIAKLDPELELRNLTDQVYELAKIVQAKMRVLERSRILLILIGVSWLGGMLSAILVIVMSGGNKP